LVVRAEDSFDGLAVTPRDTAECRPKSFTGRVMKKYRKSEERSVGVGVADTAAVWTQPSRSRRLGYLT